ncbi:hypothetical protein GCM10010094_30950 [Streptomyces flaveus]|uniref:Uncharacterized protein n=1 Tax=Streptomyces flaveus TaxID=66370 RepID=A0A917VE27_9ACTN|nr:hypothetical protein GCM10010094_30950 [Streptomyces flaveus]
MPPITIQKMATTPKAPTVPPSWCVLRMERMCPGSSLAVPGGKGKGRARPALHAAAQLLVRSARRCQSEAPSPQCSIHLWDSGA